MAPLNDLPTEVELVYEVMPCAAMRVAQEPGESPHPCTYFRRWGRYHSYRYEQEGPPPTPTIVQQTQYVGRAYLSPEMVSGCRKAPILAVGINPNLPGWWPRTYSSVNPLFNDYRQFAHYFRYRTIDKLQVPVAEFAKFGGPQAGGPLQPTKPPLPAVAELQVPVDEGGLRTVPIEPQEVTMYATYQSLLDDLAKSQGWQGHRLSIGEDIAYGNMVACPSAKWINRPDAKDPTMPPMTSAEQRGIVAECFHKRRHFLRQLFQTLPGIVMVFSQSTTDAFVGEMSGRFSLGDPQVGEPIADLLKREIRLRYGTTGGQPIEARVIFSPHITGDPAHFQQARKAVLDQLIEEARRGRIGFNAGTGHLRRPQGSCSLCPTLGLGACGYASELVPLGEQPLPPSAAGVLRSVPDAFAEKRLQARLLAAFLDRPKPSSLSAAGPAALWTADTNPVIEDSAARGWVLSADPERHRKTE